MFLGNQLAKKCGPSAEELCIPCKPKRFAVQPKDLECKRCTQCVGMWTGHPPLETTLNLFICLYLHARYWMIKRHFFVGAQVLVKECTPMSDTVCGCKEGLVCGDAQCSFCVTACDKGHGPSGDGTSTARAAAGQLTGGGHMNNTNVCLCRFLQNLSQRNLL